MNPLEILLISIIWMAYGAFAAYQTQNDNDRAGTYICYVFIAPLIFIIKAFYGAFKKYE